jgi:hypothetical protein
VNNYDNLAEWTVFTQGETPNWGYRGHRHGGGHMMRNPRFQDVVEAHKRRAEEPEFFVFTSAISLTAGSQAPNRLWTAFRTGWGVGYDPAGKKVGMCPNVDAPYDGWPINWLYSKDWLGMVERLFNQQPHSDIRKFDLKATIPELFDIKPAEGTVYFSQGARFAASREAIRRRPKAYYQRLFELTDVGKDPWIGYVMEWVWYYMLGGDPAPCGTAHAKTTRQHFDQQDRNYGPTSPIPE